MFGSENRQAVGAFIASLTRLVDLLIEEAEREREAADSRAIKLHDRYGVERVP